MASKRPDYPPFAWSPISKETSLPVSPLESEKKLTVVTYDQGIRKKRWLKLAYKCLELQDKLSEIEIVHLEWTRAPNPVVIESGIAHVFAMGMPDLRKRYPAWDLGIQWNLGLFLAPTPWVCFYHCDLIGSSQIATVLDKIDQNPSARFFEGYAVNRGPRGVMGTCAKRVEEMERLLSKCGGNPTTLASDYRGNFRSPPHENGYLATFHKEYLVDTFDGFFWNVANFAEIWNGLGRAVYERGPLRAGLRQLLKAEGVAMTAQEDMGVFDIPHSRSISKRRNNFLSTYSSPKFYSDFVRDWIPQHPPKLVAGPRNANL